MNPRRTCTLAGFQDQCHKPLAHSSLFDFKVQSTNFASTSFLLVEEFFSWEMTVNLPLNIIRYHHDFIQVIGTNFIVTNSHLVWTTTELDLASACQLCSTLFASDSNHLIAFNLLDGYGRYWIWTSDLLRVKQPLYHWVNLPRLLHLDSNQGQGD